MKSSKTIATVSILTALWLGVGVANQACTPKREAAAADLVTKESKCATSDLNRTPQQMLIDCGIPSDAQEIKDIIDLFTGTQASAVKAGASLPKAGMGTDAGAR